VSSQLYAQIGDRRSHAHGLHDPSNCLHPTRPTVASPIVQPASPNWRSGLCPNRKCQKANYHRQLAVRPASSKR